MKQTKWACTVKTVCFLLAVGVMIGLLNRVFIPKWTTTRDNRMTQIVRGFYDEPENSLDIIFLGNSDVYRGISPAFLWEEYGYPSYARSTPGQKLWVSYYQLLETLEYQTPSLIVMDLDSLFEEDHSGEGNYRKSFDNMRLSAVKWQAIHDPVFEFDFETRAGYLVPFLRYHSRWNQLTEEDFTYYFTESPHFAYKGLDLSTDVVPYEGGYSYMDDTGETAVIGERALHYMNKITALCKEKNMELLLVEIPSAISWTYAKSQAAQNYAKENGLTFLDLNLLGESFGFDWMTDSGDGGDHLNVWGAEKVTGYLGEYIHSHYDLTDRRDDLRYSAWTEDMRIYEQDKVQAAE